MRIPSGVGGKFPTQKPAIDKVAEHIDDVVTVAESITRGRAICTYACTGLIQY